MNKIQIKAEVLAALAAFSTSAQPNPSLLTDLKQIDDKKNYSGSSYQRIG